MKTLKNKILVILALAFAVCLMAVSTAFISTAKADVSTPPTLTMLDGASVRVDGTDVNGLRFAAGMSESDYGWFSENVGADKAYKDVQFGMFIAPANYLSDYADFTLGTLFGDNDATVKYDWAEWDNDAQKWVYDDDSDKVRIINIKKSTLKEYKGQMAIIGAISDYNEYNIVKDFVGLGYYQLTDANDKVTNYLATYTGADKANNTRSMIEVIQTAMEDDTLVPEQEENAKEKYFDKIAANVSVKDERISVVGSTTVAGNAYNGEMNSVDISTVVYTYKGKSTEFKLNDWTTHGDAITIDGSIVKGVSLLTGGLIQSKYMTGVSLLVDVYTPISSRADLDALGFDYLEDQVAEKWSLGNRYMLTNDIDYATDTSVYNSATKGNMRMDDGNDTVDMWDKYLIPIAPNYVDYNNTASRSRIGTYEWGIFGALSTGDSGGATQHFCAILDGAGYAIKNAVIPYGTFFAYGDININHGQNFIGSLVYGGQLRNIAFTGLEFEDPTQIANAGVNNPYYTDKNTNNDGKTLKTNGYITGSSIFNVNYGKYLAMNASNRTGLVGAMQNAIISNVYVEAAMKSGTYGLGAKNGLIVAHIYEDAYNNNTPLGGICGKVENCITKTSYTTSNVGYFGDADGAINAGMGAVVGYSKLSETAVANCFVIGNLVVGPVDGVNVSVDTIFTPNPKMFADYKKSTNCGVYASASALQEAQASVLANMSIAKYVG